MSDYRRKFLHQPQVFNLNVTWHPKARTLKPKMYVHYWMSCHNSFKYFDFTVSYVCLKHSGRQITLEICHIIASALYICTVMYSLTIFTYLITGGTCHPAKFKSTKLIFLARFEVFTAVTMDNAIIWVVTLCDSCKNWHFGGMYHNTFLQNVGSYKNHT
jgi:hypothetical protein